MKKVLIVGAGNQSILADKNGSGNENKIISFYKALKEHKGFEIIGFVDKDITKAIKAIDISLKDNILSDEWQISESLKAFSNKKMDIIIIATSDDMHYQNLKDIIKYDIKAKLVICEKPLCETTEQIKEIIKLYKKAKIPLLVNYTRRFIQEYKDLKKNIDEKKFGKLVGITVKYNRGLIHTFSHIADTLNYLFGNDAWIKKTIVIDFIKCNYRVFEIEIFWENYHWKEERKFKDEVDSMFDTAMYGVIENAYNFLENNEELLCTAEDAKQALINTLIYRQ
jgi:predicted dehydrogenase